jgi:hypothetical protein
VILTDEEKQMRDGAEGAAAAAAMDLLIRYGDALAADRLCDVRNVAGTMTQPSPVKERLVREGGWDKAFAVINLDCDTDIEVPAMRVPTCQLQHGFGPDARGVVPCPEQRIELQQDAEAFYGRRGVNILATCTPYQVGNIPVRDEHIAWMESSAVIYANSVLGARTNCEGTASAGAASLTGKIPCWGNHRDENRFGTHLIDVQTPVDSFLDWGMLGYFAGGVAGEEHPVLTGAARHGAGRHDHHPDQHQVRARRGRHPGACRHRPRPGSLRGHPHRRLGPRRRHPRPHRGQTRRRKELTVRAAAQQLRAGHVPVGDQAHAVAGGVRGSAGAAAALHAAPAPVVGLTRARRYPRRCRRCLSWMSSVHPLSAAPLQPR